MEKEVLEMIVAELSTVPVGTGTPSVSKYVTVAVKELEKMHLNPKLNAMCTEFESSDIKTVCTAFENVHNALFKAGAERVVTTLKIDERRDKNSSIEKKILAVKNKKEW